MKYLKSRNASQDDKKREPELDEFVNNNFDNQDFASVNSDCQGDQGASECLDFNKIIREMLLDLLENSKITAATTCIIVKILRTY